MVRVSYFLSWIKSSWLFLYSQLKTKILVLTGEQIILHRVEKNAKTVYILTKCFYRSRAFLVSTFFKFTWLWYFSSIGNNVDSLLFASKYLHELCLFVRGRAMTYVYFYIYVVENSRSCVGSSVFHALRSILLVNSTVDHAERR